MHFTRKQTSKSFFWHDTDFFENIIYAVSRVKFWKVVAAPILLLVWHRLFRIWLCWHHRLYSQKSRCHAKRRMGAATRAHPSFGMTKTKTLKSVFWWHASYLHVLILLTPFGMVIPSYLALHEWDLWSYKTGLVIFANVCENNPFYIVCFLLCINRGEIMQGILNTCICNFG